MLNFDQSAARILHSRTQNRASTNQQLEWIQSAPLPGDSIQNAMKLTIISFLAASLIAASDIQSSSLAKNEKLLEACRNGATETITQLVTTERFERGMLLDCYRAGYDNGNGIAVAGALKRSCSTFTQLQYLTDDVLLPAFVNGKLDKDVLGVCFAKDRDFKLSTLYSAIRNKLPELVNLVLESEGELFIYDSSALLNLAVSNGKLEILKSLVDKAGLKLKSAKQNLVTEACILGYSDIVKYLLEDGTFDPVDNGRTLAYAASNGHTDVVKVLLESNVPFTEGHLERALSLAVADKKWNTAKYLLERGDIDPSKVARDLYNQPDLFKLVWKNPLFSWRYTGIQKWSRYIKDLDIVKMIVEDPRVDLERDSENLGLNSLLNEFIQDQNISGAKMLLETQKVPIDKCAPGAIVESVMKGNEQLFDLLVADGRFSATATELSDPWKSSTKSIVSHALEHVSILKKLLKMEEIKKTISFRELKYEVMMLEHGSQEDWDRIYREAALLVYADYRLKANFKFFKKFKADRDLYEAITIAKKGKVACQDELYPSWTEKELELALRAAGSHGHAKSFGWLLKGIVRAGTLNDIMETLDYVMASLINRAATESILDGSLSIAKTIIEAIFPESLNHPEKMIKAESFIAKAEKFGYKHLSKLLAAYSGYLQVTAHMLDKYDTEVEALLDEFIATVF